MARSRSNKSSGADAPVEPGTALVIIETRGLTGAIEAADAMAKSANVTVTRRMRPDGGLIDVIARGAVGDVQAAAEAGAAAARRVGELQGVHVIPRPHAALEALLGGAPGF